ncbi:unnamed protein product [Rodentolepis nana]|uniref:mRNA_decap_C domain-containing protein n=1 Tax=Rodentolepis nana TaxID=102285 RepID=A0A0R3T9I8_RODNA|nr:unnamed protein product [Rodentolepis nana]
MDDSSIDLACIEMFDKDCLKVIDKSQCVHLYTYNKEKSEWEKSDIGGVLFAVERSSQPYFAFYIVNRQNSSKNYTQPLTSSIELLLRPPHIFFRTTKSVFSLWFFSSIDTERIYNLLKGLINKATLKERTVIPSNVLTSNKQSTTLAPVCNFAPKASNIKDLLSFATEEYNRSNGDDAIHPIAPAFDPSKSLKFQLQDIALDALPLTPGFGDCQFASDLEKSFKASAATTSKLDNSVTETPVHAVKSDDNDKINEELLRRLRIQDSSHGDKSPSVEGLSKNQFKAALIHLIETDDDLLSKLHSAYAESLNKRLNRRA